MRRLITLGIAISVLAIAPIAIEATADDIDVEETTDDTDRGLTRSPSSLSDSDLDARLRFLEERLDAGKKYTQYWQWGWTGGYSMGIVIGTTQAILEDGDKKRVNDIVTAVKGVIGTTRMVVDRHPGRHGAESMRAISGNSREAKLARLAEGERLLQQVAKRAERRTNWKSHAGNFALNAAGGGFIFGFGKNKDAWTSMGIGIAVGTTQILSAPKRGIQDLEDYETRFGMKTASRFDWMIVPTMGGVAVQVTF
jgi:hypothetical protein